MERLTLAALVLMSCATCAEAFSDMNVCYILDGILILYGLILTVLYCRLRMSLSDKTTGDLQKKPPAEKGLYSGLTFKNTDVYETIKDSEKPKQIE